MVQFGKEILSNQVPGWSQYYLDYKALKKIVSALGSAKPPPDSPDNPLRPGDVLGSPAVPKLPNQSLSSDNKALFGIPSIAHEDDRGPTFQAYKAAFFFKLERELEKVKFT
jgi:CDK inhibitor PHO81